MRYSLAYGNGGLLTDSNYTFISSVALQLWSVFPNGSIFYTLDGSEPFFASSYYAGPFNLNFLRCTRRLNPQANPCPKAGLKISVEPIFWKLNV